MIPRDIKTERREIQSVRLGVLLDYYGVGLTISEWLQRGSKLFSISMARIYICMLGVYTYFRLFLLLNHVTFIYPGGN